MNARPILTAALLLATAATLDAATVLTFQEAAPGAASQPKQVRRILVDGGRLRIEAAGPGAAGGVVIFKSDTGTLWVIDEGKRSYTELHRSVVPIQMEEETKGVKGAARAKGGGRDWAGAAHRPRGPRAKIPSARAMSRCSHRRRSRGKPDPPARAC